MNKKTKILCVCNQGNCRSVGTRYVLNKHGYDNVIAIGGANTSKETLSMLCKWADMILLAKPKHEDFLPCDKDKIMDNFTIGEDVYQNPLHPDLHKVVINQLKKIKLT